MCDCSLFVGSFVWNICLNTVIGLKAPGNYSDQFCFHKILILLCEGPKPNISMISGFLTFGKTVFMDLDIPKYFKLYNKMMETLFEK